MPHIDDEREPDSPLRAYLELLRLPNVFTAVADVLMGYLVVGSSFQPLPPLLALVGTSICLYLAGMVFNDLFDREHDAATRPERPIPSGRVSVRAAKSLGAALLIVALALAGVAAWQVSMAAPLLVAIGLTALILGYDKWLKHTPLGPGAMGGCRTLNVLMGMVAVPEPLRAMDWIIAAGLGVYVAGITVFARREERRSNRFMLVGGLAVMLLGLAMIATIPWTVDDWRLVNLDHRWPIFWALVAGHLAWRAGRAVADPKPDNVRIAVTSAIMSIIVIDAAASLGAGVVMYSLAILLLIVPATFLGRWIYST